MLLMAGTLGCWTAWPNSKCSTRRSRASRRDIVDNVVLSKVESIVSMLFFSSDEVKPVW